MVATSLSAEEAVVDAQVDRLEALLGGELAADPHADALRARLDRRPTA